MGVFAVIGFGIALPEQLDLISTNQIIIKFIDLICIIIPPMLPAAVSVGIVVALE